MTDTGQIFGEEDSAASEITPEEAAASVDEDATQEHEKRIPSIRDLKKLARKVSDCWYSLAIRLGLDRAAVNNIYVNNGFPTQTRKAFHALVEWRNKLGSDATYEKLSEALRQVDRHKLAQRFCSGQANQKNDDRPGQPQGTTLPATNSQSHEEPIKKMRTKEPSAVQPDPEPSGTQFGLFAGGARQTGSLIYPWKGLSQAHLSTDSTLENQGAGLAECLGLSSQQQQRPFTNRASALSNQPETWSIHGNVMRTQSQEWYGLHADPFPGPSQQQQGLITNTGQSTHLARTTKFLGLSSNSQYPFFSVNQPSDRVGRTGLSASAPSYQPETWSIHGNIMRTQSQEWYGLQPDHFSALPATNSQSHEELIKKMRTKEPSAVQPDPEPSRTHFGLFAGGARQTGSLIYPWKGLSQAHPSTSCTWENQGAGLAECLGSSSQQQQRPFTNRASAPSNQPETWSIHENVMRTQSQEWYGLHADPFSGPLQQQQGLFANTGQSSHLTRTTDYLVSVANQPETCSTHENIMTGQGQELYWRLDTDLSPALSASSVTNSQSQEGLGKRKRTEEPSTVLPGATVTNSQTNEEQSKRTRTEEPPALSSPPQNVTARSNGPTSILVQWDEVPQGDQNGDIERYDILFKDVKSGREDRRSVNAPTKHLKLSSLEKFSKYDVRVLAVTAAGPGPASSVLTVMTGEKDVPSEIELDNLSKEITPCWESVGTQLGLRRAEIDRIIANNVETPRPEQKAYSMLTAWRDQGSTSTCEKLSEALRRVQKYDLAQMFWTVESADGHQMPFGTVPEPNFSPRNVTARSNGLTSILVQWDDVLQRDRNEAIQGYDVVFKDLKTGREERKRVNAPTQHLELSSLKEFRKYDVSVLAVMADRTGPASSVLTVMTGEKELEQLRCQLAQFYEKNMRRVQVAPWDPDDTVNIDEVYTRLSWSRENKHLHGTEEKELNDYTDIFLCHDGNADPTRIAVYGQGGIGKSTFTQKLSVDWARREKEELDRFDLLLVIKLRDVCGDVMDFKEMIVQSGLLPCDETAQVECLFKYISENQDRVLILFDGFDEYDKTRDTQSDVYKIITQKMFRNCHVVVTTRPVKLDKLKQFMDAQCKINGFTRKDIWEFASKYVEEDQCETFMEYLREHNLMDMASIPLMLLLLCLLWKERKNQPFPSSRTELYQAVTQCIIDHCHAKVSHDSPNIEECSEILCKIGKVAFEALLQDSLVFDTARLSKEVLSDDIVRFGFLSMSKVQHQRSKSMASFFHKSVQEFLAAWYIAKQPLSQGISDLELLKDFDTVCNFRACLEFVCGLSVDVASAVFPLLKKIREKESLLLNTDFPRCHYCFTDDQLKFQELCYTLFLAVNHKEASVGAYFDCVGGVVLLDDYYGDYKYIRPIDGSVLALLLRQDRLVQLLLPNYLDSHGNDQNRHEVMNAFDREDVRAVTGASDQSYVKGSELFQKTASGKYEQPGFLVERKGTVLYLYYENSCSEDTCLNFSPELVRLFQPPASDQSRSKGDASEPENGQIFITHQQSSALQNELPVHVLSYVASVYFECVPEDAVLVEILKNAPHLNGLDLSDNPFGAAVSVLASQLENLPMLDNLILNNTEMSEREAADLSTALVHIPHLTLLNLGSNPLGAGVRVLASQLENLPNLMRLALDNTEMSERGAAGLSRALVHIPHLEIFQLENNPLVGRGVISLAKQIVTHVPELKWLRLSNTGMDDECKAALVKAKQDRMEAGGKDFMISGDVKGKAFLLSDTTTEDDLQISLQAYVVAAYGATCE